MATAGDARTPLVSAIVSTFNAEALLPACLEDLAAQTIADRLEIIVIDSGSAQDERSVVERFQREHGNVVYLRTRRETLYAAWNRGVALARGTYVTNANTDDAHRPDALEHLSAALDAHPDADLAYGDYAWTSRPNDTFEDPHPFRVVLHPPYHPAHTMFFCMTGCHPMWRRTLFDKLGRFDASFVAPGDYEYVMRFAAAGLRAVHVPEVLSLFFQNPTGLTFSADSGEQGRLYAKYRMGTPIHRFYRVNRRDRRAVALAWVAQGNLAMHCELPYGDHLHADWSYAVHCFEQALRADALCVAAAHNLLVAQVLYGGATWSPAVLERLPSERRDALRDDIAAEGLRLEWVDVPPAVESLEHRPPGRLTRRVPVRWVAPFFGESDDTDEAIGFVAALADLVPLTIHHDPATRPSIAAVALLSAADRRLLLRMAGVSRPVGGEIVVAHAAADVFPSVGELDYRVARMGLTYARFGPARLDGIDQLDEVWVPSEAQRKLFTARGVDAHKLHVIASPVDTGHFDPEARGELPLQDRAACSFLAVLTWSALEGWDVLLDAYLSEFSPREDVCLYVWTPSGATSEARARSAAKRRIQRRAASLGLGRRQPRVELLVGRDVPEARALYNAVDCLVAPNRGGGGRRLREAMAMALPVIATRLFVEAEDTDGTRCYPLDYGLVDAPHRASEQGSLADLYLAEPSQRHLRDLMRRVQQHPAEARRKGRRARAHVVARNSHEAVAASVRRRLVMIDRRFSRAQRGPTPARTSAPSFVDVGRPAELTLAGGRHLGRGGESTAQRGPPDHAARGQLLPRLASGLRVKRADSGLVVRHPTSDRVHFLNPTAALVVELCTGRTSWDDIIGLVQRAYDLPDRPKAELEALLDQLIEQGVIILGATPRRR